MHSVDVKLVPENNALLDSHCDDDAEGKGVFHCKVTAYVWKPTARAFKLNMKLSRHASQIANKEQNALTGN